MRSAAALSAIPDVLEEVLDLSVEAHSTDVTTAPGTSDIEARVGDHVFAIEYKSAAGADLVGAGLNALRRRRAKGDDVVPLLVVPYMGEVGKALCRQNGVSWLDLSGNADITAPGLRVRVEGRPNRYRSPGRPPDIFAPRSSRIARVLLLQPDRSFTQADLAQEAGLNPGTVSRLVGRYEEAGFVRRDRAGRATQVRVADFDLLLDAWRQASDFSTHEVRKGHIPSRSGMELLRRVAGTFEHRDVAYAATGLASAWLLAPFATFRLVTVYLSSWPARDVLGGLGFRDGEAGSNAWLVLPRDKGVFDGGGTTQGICHVSAVQTYVDLKGHPERSDEAAVELRRALPAEGNRDGRTTLL